MPLQKASPESPLTTNEATSIDRNVLKERRRTLQTISELSPQGATILEWADTSSKAGGNNLDGTTAPSSSVKSTRRRSLPSQGMGPSHDSRKNPSILVTPTEAPLLRRSLTDPTDRTRNANRRSSTGSLAESHRLSGKSFSRCRHSQDPPLFSIAEGAQSDPSSQNHAILSPQPYFIQAGALGKQSMKGPVHHSEDWNTLRERERSIREQAIVAANARREKERRIAMGSPPLLPFMSPLPMAKAKEIYIRRQGSQKQIPPYAQQVSGNHSRDLLDRRNNYGQIPQHVYGNHANRLVPQRATSSGLPLLNDQRGPLQRSHTIATEPSWTYHANSTIEATRPTRTLSSQMLAPPMSKDQHQPSRIRPCSSFSPSPNHTPSSSVSGSSHGTSQTPRSSSSRSSSRKRYYAQFPANNGRLEVFPALAVVPAAIGAQSTSAALDPKRRRYSQSSQSSRQVSLTRTTSMAGLNMDNDPTGIIQRENPDKRGMRAVASVPPAGNVLRKRGKVSQPQSEGEKPKFEKTGSEKAKEKMRERVKRANELEIEKEKELVREEKRRNRRTLFCGLFRK